MNQIPNIQHLADGKEIISLRKEFSVEELNNDKDVLYQNMQEIRKLAKQKAALTKVQAEIKKTNEALFEKVGLGFIDEDTPAYYINNLETNQREYYNEQGEFLKQRPLRPTEKANPNVFSLTKEA